MPPAPFRAAIGLTALILNGCATKPSSSPSAATPEIVTSATHLPSATPAPRDIGGILQPIRDRAGIPGVVALVLRGDRIVAQGAVGVRKKGSTERITLDDQFELASCTKAMTATLAALLIDEGRLAWDTPLGEIFRAANPTINPACENITVRELLAQRSGLEDHYLLFRQSVDRADDQPGQRKDYVMKVLARAPTTAPGAEFHYADTNYIAAAAALEEVSGQAYEFLMRERLFRSLGIMTGGFGPPGKSGQVDQPWGHGRIRLFGLLPLPGTGGKSFDPGSSNADFPRAAAPAGMAHMSVLDWAKFVGLHLRGHPANPGRVVTRLAPETFAAMHRPAAEENYVSGWFTGTRDWANGGRPNDTGQVLFHEGENGRWTSVTWVAPEIDLALLIACNRGGMHRPIDEMASALVGRFASRAPTQ